MPYLAQANCHKLFCSIFDLHLDARYYFTIDIHAYVSVKNSSAEGIL